MPGRADGRVLGAFEGGELALQVRPSSGLPVRV